MKTKMTTIVLLLSFILSLILIACAAAVVTIFARNDYAEVLAAVTDNTDGDGSYVDIGTADFVNGNYVVNYNNSEFRVSDVDFYAFTSETGQYYIADMLDGTSVFPDSGIYNMVMYPVGTTCKFRQLNAENKEIASNDLLEIVTYDSKTDDLSVIYSILSGSASAKIANESIVKSWENEDSDPLLNSLKESFVFESTYFKTHSSDNSYIAPMSSVDYVNDKQTVRVGECASYTDTDSIIKDYISKYRGKAKYYNAYGNIVFMENDYITNIIPQTYFRRAGTFSYIGKEYGFCINTYSANGTYSSEVLVFDILFPDLEQSENTDRSVEVRPLFTGAYYYDSSFNIVVFDSINSPNVDLSLKDISIQVSLSNINHPNVGDVGYDPWGDCGYYISSYNINSNGSMINQNNDLVSMLKSLFSIYNLLPLDLSGIWNYILQYGMIAADFVTENAYEQQMNDLHHAYEEEYFGVSHTDEDNIEIINIGRSMNDPNALINKYGGLPKSFDARLIEQQNGVNTEDYPVLYKAENNDSFAMTFAYNYYNNTLPAWDTMAHIQITASIFDDNVDADIDMVSGGIVEYLNSSSDSLIITSTGTPYAFKFSTNTTARAVDLVKKVIFTAPYTDTYTIETFGDANTSLSLEGSSMTSSSGYYQNSSGQNNGSRMTVSMTAGTQYIFDVHSTTGGSAYVIIKREKNIHQTKSDYNDYRTDYFNQDDIWYTFTPSKNNVYSIFTKNTQPTSIEVYDSNYNKMVTKTYTGFVDMYMMAGQRYYIRTIASSAGNYSTIIMCMDSIKFVAGSSAQSKYINYILYDNECYYLRIFVNEQSEYTFRNVTSGRYGHKVTVLNGSLAQQYAKSTTSGSQSFDYETGSNPIIIQVKYSSSFSSMNGTFYVDLTYQRVTR